MPIKAILQNIDGTQRVRSLIDDYSGLNISRYRILEKLGGAGIICVGIRSWGYVVGTVTDPSGVPGAKSFSLTERVKLRFDTQLFNVPIIRISHFRAWCWPAFLGSLLRRLGLGRLLTQPLRRPDYSALV